MECLDIIMQKLVAIESRLDNIEKSKTDIRKTEETTTTSIEPPKSKKKGRRKRVVEHQGSSSTAARRQTQPKSTNRDFGLAVKGKKLWRSVANSFTLPGGMAEAKLWALTKEFLEEANELVLETLKTSQEKLVDQISVLNPLDKSRAKAIAEIYVKRQFSDIKKDFLDATLAEAEEILGSKYVAEPSKGMPSSQQNSPGDQHSMDTAESSDVAQANLGQRSAPVVLKQLPETNRKKAIVCRKTEHKGHFQKDNTTSSIVSPKTDATGAVDLTTGSAWPTLADSVAVKNGNGSTQPKATANATLSKKKQQQKAKHKPKWKAGF